MDFSELRKVPLGDALNAIASEGGSVTAGLVGAGILGRRVQSMVKSDAEVVTTIDGVKAWAGNNVPKIAAWYLLRGKVNADIEKGIVTSAALDTLMRLLNGGVNPASATVMGYEVMGESKSLAGVDAGTVQRLIQENGQLRAQLGIKSAEGAMSPRLPPYVGSAIMTPDERDRKYAFMPGASSAGTPGVTKPPRVEQRQVRYGFVGETSTMSSAGKPGAAYVQAGKMFGMQ
jgi:hypothetical protein